MNPPSHPDWIAHRAVTLVHADGRSQDVVLRIGRPVERSGGEWACPVALDGWHGRLHDAIGIDGWQAIQLAQNLLAKLLGRVIDDGGHLLAPTSDVGDPGQPAPRVALSDLFAVVPA